MGGAGDTEQLQFQIRTGTTGPWADAPVTWVKEGNGTSSPAYRATWDFTGAALDLAPKSDRVYQIRSRRLPTQHETAPFSTSFEVALTAHRSANGMPGDFTARAQAGVAPDGLTTRIKGLPATIPADGKTRQFQIHVTTANHADWEIDTGAFFIWQGQRYGEMSGPKKCDAEVDVLDAATHTWHRVGLGAVASDQGDVKLSWGTGPVYDRTLTARITLGAAFKTSSDGRIGFGYFPGSGDLDNFWTEQKLAATPVAGAPSCVKPGTAPVTATTEPSAEPTATVSADSSVAPDGGAGTPLAATGGGSDAGLLTGVGAGLLALGGAAFAFTRRGRRQH